MKVDMLSFRSNLSLLGHSIKLRYRYPQHANVADFTTEPSNYFFSTDTLVEQSIYTLPETNIAPENRPSQKEIHLPTIQGLC